MAIADSEAALEKLREFRQLQERADMYELGDAPQQLEAAIDHIQPLIEEIARSLDDKSVGAVAGLPYRAIPASNRLIGILERQEDFRQILGPAGPTLAASGLNPWVWNAVASLWDDGHYEPAVHQAGLAVQLQTQLKVSRRDLYGKDLYAQAFSVKEPTSKMPRLRFLHIDRNERSDDWTSAHEGAMYLGMGCAQGIRNPQAHPSENISEQEALEQLAALSVLARWVDECDVNHADGDAAGA